MPSLWDNATEAEIRSRFSQLNADSQRKWGKMSIDQMLRHMAVAFNCSTGAVVLPDEGIKAKLIGLPPIKWFMIHHLPWPKDLPTAVGFTITSQEEFDAARKEFFDAFDQFMAQKTEAQFGKHPLFGSLSFNDWGVLMYKHSDHHLRQFGV